MKRLLVFMIAAVFATACTEESEYTHGDGRFETSIELAVDNERITLAAKIATDADGEPINYCVIPVYSNTSWTASLDDDTYWASLDRTSGKGCAYLYFYYTANTSVEDATPSRSTVLRLRSRNKKVEMVIEQLGAEKIGE
ncbi:MAG: BACON domain-containing protein [Alistipes sp.]|nr:BACON domain-containing protein [Alistipes sp.]